MVSSVLSKNKDVVSLIPVSKMTAEYLTELIRTVIVNLTKAGSIVCSVLSDNNVVNRKAFIALSGLPTLQPFFYNPVNNAKVYVLFDSVHILKCIRNNWLNAKSLDKTFSFPDIDDHSLIYNSSFNTLDKLYTLERGLTIKKPTC